MMREPALVMFLGWMKSALGRCKADGCWKKGLACCETPTGMNPQEISRHRQTFYWQCSEHAMNESLRKS